jgi:hypothetical protein
MSQRKRWAVMAGAVVAAASAGLWMAPAFACSIEAHLQVSPRRADPGAVVRVEGSGFEPHGSPVNVYWGGQSGALLTTAAAADGSFTIDITVPVNASPASEYLLQAVQTGDPQHQADFLFRTSLPNTASTPTPAHLAPSPVAPPHAAAAPAAAPVPPAAPAVAPSPAPVSQAAPFGSPADTSGFSSSGAPAFTPGGQPVAPLVAPAHAFGSAPHAAGGLSPWVLLPLGLLGVGLFSVAAAAVARQARQEGVRAPV